MTELPSESGEDLVLLDRLLSEQLRLAESGDIDGAVELLDRAGQLAQQAADRRDDKDPELIVRIKGRYSKLALLLADKRNQTIGELAGLSAQRRIHAAYNLRR